MDICQTVALECRAVFLAHVYRTRFIHSWIFHGSQESQKCSISVINVHLITIMKKYNYTKTLGRIFKSIIALLDVRLEDVSFKRLFKWLHFQFSINGSCSYMLDMWQFAVMRRQCTSVSLSLLCIAMKLRSIELSAVRRKTFIHSVSGHFNGVPSEDRVSITFSIAATRRREKLKCDRPNCSIEREEGKTPRKTRHTNQLVDSCAPQSFDPQREEFVLRSQRSRLWALPRNHQSILRSLRHP